MKTKTISGLLLAALCACQGLASAAEAWQVRVTGDADKYLIAGVEMGAGSAKVLEKAIAANPGAQVVMLIGSGKDFGEAAEVARLIRKHRLTTLVTEHCYDACAVAFSAGDHRAMALDAEVGFNAIETASDQQLVQELLISNGVSKQLIESAVAVQVGELWTPGVEYLLNSKLVTDAMEVVKEGGRRSLRRAEDPQGAGFSDPQFSLKPSSSQRQ